MIISTSQYDRQIMADNGKYLTLLAGGIEDKLLPLCKIVHLPLSENVGDWQEISEERAQQIRQAKAAASGDVTEITQKVSQLEEQTKSAQQTAEEAKKIADEASQAGQQSESQLALTAMLINTYELTDEQSLKVKDLYPKWQDLIGQTLQEGFKLQYDGMLYKVLQQHAVQEDWKSSETASLYTVVSASATEEHAGTKEDPIPYVQNMALEKDKYYTQYGVLYVCIQSTLTGYPNDLKDMASVVQEVKDEESISL